MSTTSPLRSIWPVSSVKIFIMLFAVTSADVELEFEVNLTQCRKNRLASNRLF